MKEVWVKLLPLSQRVIRIDNLPDRLLKLCYKLIGKHVLHDREAVGFDAVLCGIQLVQCELKAVAQFGLLDVTVVHSKLLLKLGLKCPAGFTYPIIPSSPLQFVVDPNIAFNIRLQSLGESLQEGLRVLGEGPGRVNLEVTRDGR